MWFYPKSLLKGHRHQVVPMGTLGKTLYGLAGRRDGACPQRPGASGPSHNTERLWQTSELTDTDAVCEHKPNSASWGETLLGPVGPSQQLLR